MFITLGFYKRRPDISREDFSCHWREIHGPLLRNTPSISRYLRRYVQHHLTPGVGFNNVMPLDCDGFSEAWFDTMQDRQAMHAEKEFKERVIPDEATFIDMSATRFLMFDNQVTQIGVDLMLQLSSNQN